MALTIVDLFGYPVADVSPAAREAREKGYCPFLKSRCVKAFNDGTVSGVCTVKQTTKPPVICCPNRLYAHDYQILRDVATSAFEREVELINGSDVGKYKHDGRKVAVFGKRWGKELRLPRKSGIGNVFVDWILVRIGPTGKLAEFVAVEAQSIDTTGTYRPEWERLMRGKPGGVSSAGLNWANVSKRILPQLIYKGHVLRREPNCKGGLFFICPTAVYKNIRENLGAELNEYSRQPGSITFKWYDRGASGGDGTPVPLVAEGEFTTTVDQLAFAFSAPSNLPERGVYEQAIVQELQKGTGWV